MAINDNVLAAAHQHGECTSPSLSLSLGLITMLDHDRLHQSHLDALDLHISRQNCLPNWCVHLCALTAAIELMLQMRKWCTMALLTRRTKAMHTQRLPLCIVLAAFVDRFVCLLTD